MRRGKLLSISEKFISKDIEVEGKIRLFENILMYIHRSNRSISGLHCKLWWSSVFYIKKLKITAPT